MKKKIIIIGVFLLLILTIFIFLNKKDKIESPVLISKVEIADKILKVDAVSTIDDQERGLSGRQNLNENEGMLFVFEKPGKNYFWMKDMNFPIDIIWINEDAEIIFIKKNALPDSYPEVFGPDIDSKYVLEVNSGFSEKNNLRNGEKVKFLP